MKRRISILLKKYPSIYIFVKNTYERFFYSLNKIFNNYFEKRRFKKYIGYGLNLKDPRSFNEKIIHKKIYNRNSLIPKTADKYEVRNYVKEVLGEEEGSKVLIPLLYVTDNPETIPFEKLPKDFVIKANHGSGWNIIVRNGIFDKKEILKKCKIWVKVPYGLEKMEWAYQPIDRKIIIEKFISDENGKSPKDYKFFIFNGRCQLIEIDFDRFENHTRSLFDKNWKYVDVSLKFPKGKRIEKPKQFEKMKNIAEALGKNFEFVRVDFYLSNKNIYLGEMTHYPGSGHELFTPIEFDFDMGKKWKM